MTDPNLTCLATELRETTQSAIDADWNGQPTEILKQRCKRLRERLDAGETYDVRF